MATEDRVAIVTGAAQGIGKIITSCLLDKGYQVFLFDINPKVGQETTRDFQQSYGETKASFILCDVSSKTQFTEAFSNAVKKCGHVSLMVNNAGILNEHEYERCIAINLTGVITGTNLAIDHMRTDLGGKGGTIVNISSITDREVVIGGDGRCDSPGYCAKYGSYTLMDLDTNKILDVQLVQSNEVKSSTHMELEGLKRGLDYLTNNVHVNVNALVTDRHVMIKKYMKDNHQNINHFFDVWHIAKAIETFYPVPTYCATKSAVLSFTRNCAENPNFKNVSFMNICPETVETELLKYSSENSLDPAALDTLKEAIVNIRPETFAKGFWQLITDGTNGSVLKISAAGAEFLVNPPIAGVKQQDKI